MEKRTLLAVLLTMVVWIGWFWFFEPKQPVQNSQNPIVQETNTAETVKPVQVDSNTAQTAAVNTITAGVKKNIKEEIINLKTEKFTLELTNKGASISKANYIERNVDLTLNEKLFGASGNLDFSVHFSENDFFNGNDLNADLWNVAKSDDKTVKFFTNAVIEGNPLRVEKIFKFSDKGYAFNVEYRFINTGKQPVKFRDGKAIFSPSDTLGPKLDYTNRYNHMMGIFSVDDSYSQNTKGSGFFSKAGDLKKEAGKVDYTGIMSRYFLLIMIPEQFNGTEMVFDNREQTGFRTGMSVDMGEILPGKELVKSFKIYLGEKDKAMLKGVDPKIVKASDVSTIIEPIRYFVVWCLTWINKLFGNMGWSLVVFSILTKIVFMPLTKKSTDSMKKMQELTPQINKLKEKFKDKPDMIQKETMKLYKENKVNPLGGCLPLLLQMPFFFGLYSALINSIDMWNVPFMLWIKDLSMPDTVFAISGFNINILPLLMTVSTIIQQKQTMVDTGNQQQKMMMYMMPFVLLFVFWTMPSGLVLYWFLQNLYQILNQEVVNHLGKRKEAKA
jgi:YidC/Oxa1 family membrane protein insertase